MKRLILFGTIVFWALGLMAEAIPANYYDAIDGKQDSVLKSTLSELVLCLNLLLVSWYAEVYDMSMV